MPESETGTPTAASVPATPDTPGGPLFTSLRVDSLSHERNSFTMNRCKCFPTKDQSCFTDFSLGVSLPNVSLTQKVGAEFVGTFILIFAATAGPIVNNKYNGVETLMGNAACAGLTVMFIILSIGHISGAHLNPSLTIAFAAFRHFPWTHVPAYIAAQVSASICACFALKGVYHPFLSGGVTVPSVSVGQAFATEFIITFILLFVVTAVATDTRAVGEMAGIAVGATVLLNILISGPTSGGSMNPVRTPSNTSLILAQRRTTRKDPLDDFNRYTGGWNISNRHYIASVVFTAVPFFVVAAVWFVIFGLSLSLICLCYCCCPREPYGYSRLAYALSLIFLILFTVAAIVGCVLLYTAQGKFHGSTTSTLEYVVGQAEFTAENLRNVSDYLDAAKKIGVDAVFLPADVQKEIDEIKTKINSSASELSSKTKDNSETIKDVIDAMRLALVILAAVMLFLAFVGFLLSIFGLQGLVYFLILIGWILVAGTFVLCGIFLFLHNVVGDTCVAMDQWVQNPTAQTALDEILPCVDNATAQETLTRTRDVTHELVKLVNNIVSNVTNRNFPPAAGPLYYNQSGPLMPLLCNPFNPDLTNRSCAPGEVPLDNAAEGWKNYTCEVSSSGICKTPGRMTPIIYGQIEAAVNISYGLYHYGPFLVDLQDCTFVRKTFTDIGNDHCPGLQTNSELIYIGLVLVSAAVMLSLIFWVIYARERRHRVYTKQFIDG